MKKLFIADPVVAGKVQTELQGKSKKGDVKAMTAMADEIIWALSRETTFGKALAMGFAGLMGNTDTACILRYARIVHEAGVQGPAFGRLMATYLVPVICKGRGALLEQFLATIDIMMGKGVYTLKDPLDVLADLLNEGDKQGAEAFLDLLQDTFSRHLTYNRSMHFTCILPRAVHAFSPLQRAWQTRQLARAIRTDVHLVEPFLDGLAKGLTLLHEKALEQFVSTGLQEFKQKPDTGIRFLSLVSNKGMEKFQDLQVTVGLAMLCFDLNCYLCARTGPGLTVRSTASLPLKIRAAEHLPISVFSDAGAIYLPDTIGHYTAKNKNEMLYKCLVKVEAGLHEFGSFDFDLEKLAQRWPHGRDCFPDFKKACLAPAEKQEISDLERFFTLFPQPGLAQDLFTVFEHGRIRLCLSRRYPGLVKNAGPLFQTRALQMVKKEPSSVVFSLYLTVALNISPDVSVSVDAPGQEAAREISGLFKHRMEKDPVVETSAELTAIVYDRIAAMTACHRCPRDSKDGYRCMQTPFGFCIRPDLYFAADRSFETMAGTLKAFLADKNLQVYKSDVRRSLVEKGGVLDIEDVKKIVLAARRFSDPAFAVQNEAFPDLSGLELDDFFKQKDPGDLSIDSTCGLVFRYREWDCRLNDYLNDHTRVLEKNIRGIKNDFYARTLERRRSLVTKIRHAFELLKPEGLVLLRPWLEGDEFDYHSLLDFAVDKKAGRMPGERLYCKRIKQKRDVAVLLLVDLSRSTANLVRQPGLNQEVSVLDIEKEAIVLFCEALTMVGDCFSIAGFSGTGRLGVDYFKIKDFDQTMEEGVKERINAMAPQRSTRMGAAIRHAAARLVKVPARVRLLIILGDGFPNDTGYKREYAVSDTRKAVFEAHSKQIFTHAITVNMARDAKLDAIYGEMNHNVISNVCELPDRLLGIYSALTRS